VTRDQLDQMRGCVTHPKVDATTVKITCDDGDVFEGFIELIDDDERDVVCQILTSNKPEKYKAGTSYLVRLDDIVDFRRLKD
jgi:hypothetical protein